MAHLAFMQVYLFCYILPVCFFIIFCQFSITIVSTLASPEHLAEQDRPQAVSFPENAAE